VRTRNRSATFTFEASLLLLLVGNHYIATAQSAGTFTATGSLVTARAFHTATLLTNGKVLVAGGSADFTGPVATAELYDPDKGTFTSAGNMTVPRSGHTATLLPDGKVLIAGGSVSAGGGMVPSNGAEIYDPSSGTFSVTGTMIGNHVCQQAILLGNGKVLLAGGSVSGAADRVPNAELYDPATNTFAATGAYVTDTHLFGFNTCQGSQLTLLPDGRALIVFESGGAELYDPSLGAFTRTGDPITGSHNNGLPAATLLMSGNVLVAGGANDAGFHTSAGLYNLSTGTFTATGNMVIGRALNTATLLPHGDVLLAGSYVFGGGSLASAELYDPVTGTFTATHAMTTTRHLHTATLLNNGKVLIVGGTTFGRPTPLAEIYTPTVLVPSPKLMSVLGDAREQGAIWHASTGEIASPRSPAVAGEVLSMYTTSLAQGGLIPPQVAIGGQMAEILYFGAAPGYPGYNQVNIRVRSGVAPGPAVPVRLTYISRPSNEVTIGVR
jgi:hypothetical protein